MTSPFESFQTKDGVPLRPGMVIYQRPVIFDDDGVRVKWIEPRQLVVDDFAFEPEPHACFITPKQGHGRAYLSDCYSTRQGAIAAAIEKFQRDLQWEIHANEAVIERARGWLQDSAEPGWFEQIFGGGEGNEGRRN